MCLFHPAGVWGQKEEAQLEREEGSLGRTLQKEGTGKNTACPPKYHHFYMFQVHVHHPCFPHATTHAGLQLENCKHKSQARYFWVQSTASGETKVSQTADSL